MAPKTKNRFQPNLTWNFYSGISGPLMTMLGCVVILFVRYEATPLMYLFPFLILFFTSCLALGFWLSIWAYVQNRLSMSAVKRIGRWCQRLIIGSQVLLLTVTLIRVLPCTTLGIELDYQVDHLYWILTGWAWLETTHHGVYKLLFDQKSALFEMKIDSIVDLQRPVGGSLGVMLRKLVN